MTPRLTRITVNGVPRVADLRKPVSSGTATYVLPEQSGYLPNPGIGYQGYTHGTAQIAESVEYRRSNTVLQGGFDWATMNPSLGTYNWTPVDDLLAAAAARGQQGSFRIVTTNGDEFGGHTVPAWAVTEGAVITSGEPDYRRRVYQQRWGQFVDALVARYDGDSRIAFIDISGYGLFNEWQANAFTDNSGDDFEGNGTSVDASTRRHLVHMFVGGSGTAGVTETNGTSGTMAYSHTGFQDTQLVMTYGGIWASIRYVLANYPNVGWRNDALFGPDAELADFQAIGYGIADRWKTAPVVFEPISGASSTNYPAGVTAMAGMGASLMHDNSLALSGLTNLVAPLGYRFHCAQLQVPSTAAAGASALIHTTWRNTGIARAYPRMGQDFAVCLALANAAGTIVGTWTTGWSVSTWLPGVVQEVNDSVTLPSVPAGTYTVCVGIVEQNTGTRILLPLATNGRSDKWYPAGTITVTSGTAGYGLSPYGTNGYGA